MAAGAAEGSNREHASSMGGSPPARRMAMPPSSPPFQHPRVTSRTALQAGAVGLLGLGMNHLEALRALAGPSTPAGPLTARRVIYIFLSGGLSQLDSFDLKPDAPDKIRGEFKPIATRMP